MIIFGETKTEIENTILAAENQALRTKCFKENILKEEIEIKCKLCKEYQETVDYLTSGYFILAKKMNTP
jgi:hypothetical protein